VVHTTLVAVVAAEQVLDVIVLLHSIVYLLDQVVLVL
jgi:hypothetical protein